MKIAVVEAIRSFVQLLSFFLKEPTAIKLLSNIR